MINSRLLQYVFKDRESVLTYKDQGRLDYMLLTYLKNITHDTMLDPREFRAWSGKIQTCINRK